MDAQQIKVLIDAMASSDLAEMEFSRDGWTLRLVRRACAEASAEVSAKVCAPADPDSAGAAPGALSPTTAEGPPMSAPRELAAPLYGVVHLRPSPGEPPFVTTGQQVRAGQTLCVIEAMKVFNEVRAEFDASVEVVLVASGDEVEAGQPLLRFA